MTLKLIKFCLLLCVSSVIASPSQEKHYDDVKRYHKRLETVDGVEIASSYVEYLDLAFGDLDDRLKKAYTKLADFRERITKRSNLLKEILSEIDKRHIVAEQLTSRDKFLRTRLIRNTEMKSALQNLADIAGYKLNPTDHDDSNTDATQLPSTVLSILKNTSVDTNISHVLADSLTTNNSTYTRYIELAYTEVNEILTNDKQELIEVIRRLKTNEMKLSELGQLSVKVKESLARLREFESRLGTLISHESEIANTLVGLEKKIKNNKFDGDRIEKSDVSDDVNAEEEIANQ